MSLYYFSPRCNEAGRVVYTQYPMQQHRRGEILFIHIFVNTVISPAGDVAFNLQSSSLWVAPRKMIGVNF